MLIHISAQPELKSYIILIVSTILAYDWLCTIDEEVAYVWSRPWSLGTFVFILNRYLPAVDTYMVMNLAWMASSPQFCYRHHVIMMWFLASGMFLSELILILRTYAIWNGQRSILICLILVALVTLSTLLAVLIVGMDALTYGPAKGPNHGCNIIRTNDITLIYYLTILASETIIVILTVIKAIQNRGSRSSWVLQLSRDGLVFYVFMLGMTIANVVVTVTTSSPRYKNFLAFPQRVLHSILCTRVILLILRQRATYSMDDYPSLSVGVYSNHDTSEVLTTVIETCETTNFSTLYPPNWTR
ncbi:hypothetical protein BDZ94DRAFT_129860 [Collybia nuda]|uniref:DUF6533 domain-containing protein n=1 Tax=Collybia nuda TaxID=64659 RepID=A0A9P5YDV3_9AGAR|nr:hypothetical protein BDZ94DRAFT_129860 [Collybia nuda]